MNHEHSLSIHSEPPEPVQIIQKMLLDAKILLTAALSSIAAWPVRRAVVAVDTDDVDLRVSGSPESLRP